MFVFTMKASGIKFFAVLTVAVAVLVLLISILPAISAASDAAAGTTDYRKIEEAGARLGILKAFVLFTDSAAKRDYYAIFINRRVKIWVNNHFHFRIFFAIICDVRK